MELSAFFIVWCISFLMCMTYAIKLIREKRGTYGDLVTAIFISALPIINVIFSIVIVFSFISDTGVLEKQVFKD